MSNFLLKDPHCVLIHIPKTGGSTIRRGIWDGRYEGPAFGIIPQEWAGFFKFAFVRHPLDRLVSAWADFSQLRSFHGSIDDFIEIVVDDSIIYDERRSTQAEKIRHHTIPQTHPFNCLAGADFLGRYETYLEDLDAILKRVGMTPPPPPQMRKTRHEPWNAYLQGDALKRAVEYFEEDFTRLGYPKP